MPRHDGMGSKGAPPAPRLVVRSSFFDHPRSDIPGYVHGHPFNNAMELFLPVPEGYNSKQVVVTNTDALGTPQPFFHGLHAPLRTFVSPEFVTTYIKSGAEFLAVSNATPIDRTDAAAVTPDGKLHLALTKQSYERLGLVGTTSAFAPQQRHNVTIDLRAKSFVPGRKLHDRVQECLTSRAGSLDFLCLCIKDGKPLEVPARGGVKHGLERNDRLVEGLKLPVLGDVRREPSDIAQPMEFDWGSPRAASWEDPTGIQPDSNLERQQEGIESVAEQGKSGGGQRHDRKERGSGGEDSLLEESALLALHEWIGAVACGAVGTEVRTDLTGARVSSTPSSSSHEWFAGLALTTESGSSRAVRWAGLIAPSQVLHCVGFARNLIAEERVPWAALTVWGFADAPVSGKGDVSNSTGLGPRRDLVQGFLARCRARVCSQRRERLHPAHVRERTISLVQCCVWPRCNEARVSTRRRAGQTTNREQLEKGSAEARSTAADKKRDMRAGCNEHFELSPFKLDLGFTRGSPSNERLPGRKYVHYTHSAPAPR